MPDPTREDVERQWRALIDGTISREEVHEWAVPRVEGGETGQDPLVNVAVQFLHGCDLSSPNGGERRQVRHGSASGWDYIRSMAEIASARDRWHADLAVFDRDPYAWRRERFLRVRDGLIARGHAEVAQALEATQPEFFGSSRS
jgi:hypothetical protein